ncbi:MAG: RIP metalloprotease RseP [Verrucomicrobiota bacterium]
MEVVLNGLQFVGILALVVLVFNVLIIVHEWGHYLAARWRGLKVEKFQIWFGKPLWRKEINGVQYGLGSIPAGGFVALPQMAPMEMLEGSTDEDGEPREPLPPISPLDKIIVAFAGPLFSFGLAVVFACLVWIVGHPVPDSRMTTTIGYVGKDSPAAEAGLKPGDVVKAVDGHPVDRFNGLVDSVTWYVVASEGEQIIFDIDRDGKAMEVPVTPVIEEREYKGVRGWVASLFQRPELRKVGIEAKETPMVGKLYANSPAEKAGLEKNDLIVGMNGEPLYSKADIGAFISEHPGKALTLEVARGGTELSVEVTPEKPENYERQMLGIQWDIYGKRVLRHPDPITQVGDSLRTMVNTLGAVFSPKSNISAGHLSGPAGIMRLYYNLFKHPDGWKLVLWFSVILNINLAVLNMLPFPVLDGGHITMATLEAIRRKPINVKVLEVVQTGCALLLIGFMIFVTMKDAGDMFGGPKGEEGPGAPIFPSGPSGGAAD